MTSVPGFHFSGDQPKAKVKLRLAGLTDGWYYVLGDQLVGELTIIPQQDMELRSIVFKLDYLMKGKREKVIIPAEAGNVEAPRMLKGGQLNKVPISIPYRFPRSGYKGEHLVSYWRLNVFLDYDPAQYHQSFAKRVLKIVPLEERHGTSFGVLVKHGKGSFRASPKELPISFIDIIPLPSLNTFSWMLMSVSFLSFLILDSRIVLEDVYVVLLLFLVVAIIWLFIRLSIFQMTPMEVQPLRDGQLRLRILDRGNGHLKNAVVGYRLLECYTSKKGKNETQKKSTRFQKTFPFGEVSRREEYFYEAILPWPETDLPTSGISGRIGYEWEVFLLVPNPLTGGMHEKKWPIEVSRELFRLAPPTEKELEQEGLEVLKLKELEYLPKPAGRKLR